MRFGRLKKPGLVPGALVYTGENEEEFNINYLEFNNEIFKEDANFNIEKINSVLDTSSVVWLNVQGINNLPDIRKIGEIIGIDNLILEEILNVDQRPKVEITKNYSYCVLRLFYFDTKNKFNSEQFSIYVKGNVIVTFQEKPHTLFNIIKNRIKKSPGVIKKKGVDYLIHSILDLIVDYYEIVIDELDEKVSRIEEEINEREFGDRIVIDIYNLRRDVSLFRKKIMPVGEIVSVFIRNEIGFVKRGNKKYYQDTFEHVFTILEVLDNQRDVLSDLLSLYHTTVNNRMNEIMKTLTIVTSIFIPLSFIVGIYGMNFDNMPELSYKYGYYIIWGVIILVSFTMVMLFKKMKWI